MKRISLDRIISLDMNKFVLVQVINEYVPVDIDNRLDKDWEHYLILSNKMNRNVPTK